MRANQFAHLRARAWSAASRAPVAGGEAAAAAIRGQRALTVVCAGGGSGALRGSGCEAFELAACRRRSPAAAASPSRRSALGQSWGMCAPAARQRGDARERAAFASASGLSNEAQRMRNQARRAVADQQADGRAPTWPAGRPARVAAASALTASLCRPAASCSRGGQQRRRC